MTINEEAARVCDETVKLIAGERAELRTPANSADPEFSDDAFGFAAEVAMAASDAFSASGVWPGQKMVWLAAAVMLRGGYKRGPRVVAAKVRP